MARRATSVGLRHLAAMEQRKGLVWGVGGVERKGKGEGDILSYSEKGRGSTVRFETYGHPEIQHWVDHVPKLNLCRALTQ